MDDLSQYLSAEDRAKAAKLELLVAAEDARMRGEVPKGDKADASIFEGKEATSQESVQWVADNIAIKNRDPRSAPSPEAWGMLQWAINDDDNETKFWTVVYPQLLKAKAAAEDDNRKRDDGRVVFDVIDRLEYALRN